MSYVYGGHSPNHPGIGQPILPPSPYSSPYGGNAALPGELPQTFDYSPWQPSTALPYEHNADGPPPWARPADPAYGGQYPYGTTASGHHHGRQRSNSRNYGQYDYPTTSYYGPPSPAFPNTTVPNYVSQSKTYHIHPLLDGLIQNSTLTFNLSSPNYSPTISLGPGNWSRIPDHELRHPATWPPVHRLRIICDFLPQWPIDIEPDPAYGYSSNLPPIQIGDVLWKIWHSMRTAIAQLDWASLPADKQEAVTKAFYRRFKPYGNAERERGVLRIDYTLGKVWFKGLTRVGEGLDVLKMHVV